MFNVPVLIIAELRIFPRILGTGAYSTMLTMVRGEFYVGFDHWDRNDVRSGRDCCGKSAGKGSFAI